MSAPLFVRGNYSDLYGPDMLPAMEDLFRSELPLHPSRREQLFNMKKTDNGMYQASELHDMPMVAEIPEGTDYSFSRPRAGASKTIRTVKYGLGFTISKEAIADGKIDAVADAIRKMAKSVRESQEIQAMDVFNNAFTTQTTSDGVALCSTAHTLPSGLTFRNRPSADADLSESALKTWLNDFETQFKGDTGIINRMVARKLLIPTSQRWLAAEILKSELRSGTANNDMNVLKGEGLEIISSPHLTDDDASFLLAEKGETSLLIVSSNGVESKSEEVFINDSFKFKTSYREKVDVVRPHGVYGSTGA